jgi:hypothetical protein
MAEVRLTVSVDDAHLPKLQEVAKDAEAAGMRVESVLREVGVLTGTIDSEAVARLRRVPGVEHVEEERRVGIAPPGGKVQ